MQNLKRKLMEALRRDKRRGSVLVLSAIMMVLIFGFTAFTVDLGYLALAKTQMQNASDAAALAAGKELGGGLGLAPIKGVLLTKLAARTAAKDVAAENRAADMDSVYIDTDRDVRFGNYDWNETTQVWETTWDVGPYNMVQVAVQRAQAVVAEDGESSSGGDAPIPLFFGPIIGKETSNLAVSATAALQPGVGVRIAAGSALTADILPIALDEYTWNEMRAGNAPDDYTYHPVTNSVTEGAGDGILEMDLYPSGNATLPPGNRGTVDFGSNNNSTSDIARQIVYGLNAFDLSYFGGELRTDEVPIVVNGDTGISAGFKDELASIIGHPRLIPLFSEVSGPGNNAMYTIVKFVGIRILDVKLTGGNKYVVVQPAPFQSSTVIVGDVSLTDESYFGPVKLID